MLWANPPSGSPRFDIYSTQYDSNGVVELNRPDMIGRKKSDAVVVGAVLLDKTITLKTIQIPPSACQDGGRAHEVRGGGALREVSLFGRFLLITGFHWVREEIW